MFPGTVTVETISLRLPTHVGVFLDTAAFGVKGCSLPHARGDVSTPSMYAVDAVASSPTHGGVSVVTAVLYPLVSVFPTHVGVSSSRGDAPRFTASSIPRGVFPSSSKSGFVMNGLPHARGVFLRRLIAVMISGSLPHARGVFLESTTRRTSGHSFCLHHVRRVFLVRVYQHWRTGVFPHVGLSNKRNTRIRINIL